MIARRHKTTQKENKLSHSTLIHLKRRGVETMCLAQYSTQSSTVQYNPNNSTTSYSQVPSISKEYDELRIIDYSLSPTPRHCTHHRASRSPHILSLISFNSPVLSSIRYAALMLGRLPPVATLVGRLYPAP
jgi:hypothetical protein